MCALAHNLIQKEYFVFIWHYPMINNIIPVSLLRACSSYLISVVALAVMLPVACSPSQETTIAEQFSPVPIQEIREEIQLPASAAAEALHIVLAQNNLEIRGGIKKDGSFTTSSIKIRDTMCQGKFLQRAPVSCQLSFQGSLKAVGEDQSSLSIRYKEYCLEQQHLPVVCKNSNAERLLFSIHKELKSEIAGY